jgi:hypothetical protein
MRDDHRIMVGVHDAGGELGLAGDLVHRPGPGSPDPTSMIWVVADQRSVSAGNWPSGLAGRQRRFSTAALQDRFA